MKLLTSKNLFLFIVMWMLGFVLFIAKYMKCCLFSNRNFQHSNRQNLAGLSNWNFFSNEEEETVNYFSHSCNSTVVTHEKAKQTVQKVCSTFPMLASSLSHLSPKQRHVLLHHLIVNDEYKFIYCYTPKVACSNWKKVVKLLQGNLQEKDFVQMDHKHGFTYLSDYSEEEIEERLKTYFKFTFVRNPTERALSVYRNKFSSVESFYKVQGEKIKDMFHQNASTENYKGKVTGDDVTFEELLRYIATGVAAEDMDEHFMPLTTLCQPCIVNYDFIGIFDNLIADSEIVLQSIKAPSNVHFPTRQSWYKPTTDMFLQYYFSLISPDLLKQFINKYLLDFTLFSFPKPTFISSSQSLDQTFCYQ